jgi:cytochrome c oxidase subunit IV
LIYFSKEYPRQSNSHISYYVKYQYKQGFFLKTTIIIFIELQFGQILNFFDLIAENFYLNSYAAIIPLGCNDSNVVKNMEILENL